MLLPKKELHFFSLLDLYYKKLYSIIIIIFRILSIKNCENLFSLLLYVKYLCNILRSQMLEIFIIWPFTENVSWTLSIAQQEGIATLVHTPFAPGHEARVSGNSCFQATHIFYWENNPTHALGCAPLSRIYTQPGISIVLFLYWPWAWPWTQGGGLSHPCIPHSA